MWEGLTLEGRARMREEHEHLTSSDLREKTDPEAFTKERILRRVLDLPGIEILPERRFEWAGKNAKG